MSNLSKRVEKAKKLRIIPATDGKGHYNVWGSNDDLYQICLVSSEKLLITPDGFHKTKVFRTACQKATFSTNYQKNRTDCKGNTQHTVCYHCLGAIWFSLKMVKMQISFYETYHDAVNGLNFGGKLAVIENQNHTGSVWCVYKKAGDKKEEAEFLVLPKDKILSVQENIALMRGNEEEGID